MNTLQCTPSGVELLLGFSALAVLVVIAICAVADLYRWAKGKP